MSKDQTQHAGTCYNPSTSEMEVGGPGVQGQPWLHRQFEASLGYVRFCLKRAKTKVKNHQIQYMLNMFSIYEQNIQRHRNKRKPLIVQGRVQIQGLANAG